MTREKKDHLALFDESVRVIEQNLAALKADHEAKKAKEDEILKRMDALRAEIDAARAREAAVTAEWADAGKETDRAFDLMWETQRVLFEKQSERIRLKYERLPSIAAVDPAGDDADEWS